MTSKQKRITMGILLGLLILNWTMGMALIIPEEKSFSDKSAGQTLQVHSSEHSQVRVTKKNAVLRIKPKKGTVIILKLPLGALLDVEEEIGDWLKVILHPDEDDFVLTGYVLRSFTEEGSIIHD